MHQVRPIGLAHGDADMGCVGGAVPAGDGNNVPGLDVFFDRGHLILRDVVDRKSGYFFLDASHFGQKRGVASEVAVAFPSGCHLADLAL